MVEYLEQLVASQQYISALSCAERLLLSEDSSVQEMVRINCALAKARVELGEYHGALVSGELAVKLARDVEMWDHFGLASFLTGAAHLFLRQPEQSMSVCLEFLEHVPHYVDALEYEAAVWYNLGFAYVALNDIQAALKAHWRSLEAAGRRKDHRKEHGARQGLLYLHLKAGEFQAVPRLLARSAHFLRHHPGAAEWQSSWLWHLLLRSEFALQTRRFARAEAVAMRGLKVAVNAPRQRFYFHMVLARIAYHRGSLRQAMGHSLSARVCAMTCRRFDLESEAADLMYVISKSDPSAAGDLDQRYITEVLDFASYLPGH